MHVQYVYTVLTNLTTTSDGDIYAFVVAVSVIYHEICKCVLNFALELLSLRMFLGTRRIVRLSRLEVGF